MGQAFTNLEGHTRRMTADEAELVADELLGRGYTRIHILGRCNGGYVVGGTPPPFQTQRGSWPGHPILVWEPTLYGPEMDRQIMDRN